MNVNGLLLIQHHATLQSEEEIMKHYNMCEADIKMKALTLKTVLFLVITVFRLKESSDFTDQWLSDGFISCLIPLQE